MATPKGYTTKEKIENYLLTEIDASFDTQISDWIVAIEDYIEKVTGRIFKADSTSSYRYFDGNGKREIRIDECVAIEEVKIYDEAGTQIYSFTKDTDYVVHPYNSLPIRKLIINPTVSGYFTKGIKNVKIKAKWGNSVAVPEPITFVASVLVGGIINFSNNADGEVKSETIGDYQITYKEDQQKDHERAMDILGSYKKYNV